MAVCRIITASVLWHRWLGGRKSIRPVKNLVPAIPKGFMGTRTNLGWSAENKQ